MRKNLRKVVSVAMAAVLTFTAAGAGTWSSQAQAAQQPDFATGTLVSSTSRVAVHDPSIVYGNDGYYYIFGSHMAWAKTKDLVNWSTVTNNINTNYATIFATPGTWAAKGSSSYDISGNLWAPDVIYNPTMGKWCMYMSVNGSNYCSSIALATADSINGPYTYKGTIVYSGFLASGTRSYTYTDYQKATGSTDVSRFLSNGSWNSAYGTNAIDPCVRFDENGDLWMSYGSWFGGIYMLKLDVNTGLRDYDYTYSTVTDESDAYMGIKLAGGYGLSGEGSYITYDEETGYYYMYLSYCGLDATDSFSGYHLRMYRSENITGPYVDAAGNSSIYTAYWDNQSLHGVKLFGNYAFSSMSGNGQLSTNGYMSGGHNSAFVDGDGQHYLVYHTRFNNGTEWHEVRVHQQFMNEDGWLVTAPYEYRGSEISETGYDKSEIVGTYEFINHGLAAATEYTDMLDTMEVMLLGDGTIAGDVSGTWSMQEGNYYATMEIGGITYKGVFFKQYDESSSHKEVMTFSLIGDNNTSIWGSKITGSLANVKSAIDSMFQDVITGNMAIPDFGDAQVTFTTDSAALSVSEDGSKLVYLAQAENTVVNVTAKITINGTTSSYTVQALVRGYMDTEAEENMVAGYDFESSTFWDISGNGNQLTSYGVYATTDSERGYVASFDGDTSYIQLPAAVTDSDDFTFIAWVKSVKNNAWERVFDFGDSEGNSIFLTTHGYNPECLRAAFAVDSAEQRANSSVIVQTGEWMHLAVTVDSANQRISLYLNGQLVDTNTVPWNITDVFNGNRNYLGKSQYSADTNFWGYMDDVAVFSTALGSEEIQYYMNNGFEPTALALEDNTDVLVTTPDTYIEFWNDDAIRYCESENSAIVKVCEYGTLKGISEGVTNVTVSLDNGITKTVSVKVEEDTEVQYGDVNTDGVINVLDMEKIQKHLLQIELLDEQELASADVVGFDGTLSVLEMEKIQKHILDIGKIVQITAE